MTQPGTTWVVYLKVVPSTGGEYHAVCEGREWNEMEREKPGAQPVVRAGFTSEPEAERFARAGPQSGEAAHRGAARRTPLRRKRA